MGTHALFIAGLGTTARWAGGRLEALPLACFATRMARSAYLLRCTRCSVVDKSHLEVQATAWRELAKRAKRLAGTLLDDPTRERLLSYSTELEEKGGTARGRGYVI